MEKRKLTLEDLAPYFPYGINGVLTPQSSIVKLTGLFYDTFGLHEVQINHNGAYALTRFKPIFRPLSDIDNIISIDNESIRLSRKFELVKDENDDWCDEYSAEYAQSPSCLIPITDMNIWLFKYHFDVFGLIDSGLAIDINTI